MVASYNNNEDAPHEPDGVALVWNMKFKKTTPEYVFHCQVGVSRVKIIPCLLPDQTCSGLYGICLGLGGRTEFKNGIVDNFGKFPHSNLMFWESGSPLQMVRKPAWGLCVIFFLFKTAPMRMSL